MAHIAVIGVGYVGSVTAGCFAELGHQVVCIEADEGRLEALRRSKLPIHEAGLEELWGKHLSSGALKVTGDYLEGLRESDFIFICVGSPSLPDGSPDLRQVLAASRSIARYAQGCPVVILKSTVPVGTAGRVEEIVNAGRPPQQRIPVISNPEFLREGQAIRDFLQPDRVILGGRDGGAAEAVASLYKDLACPFLFSDSATAEMIKYASNAFLATKISFVNEIAALCEPLGVDVTQVAQGMGMDHRIGPHFLGAGLGWGGSCLPKDTKALAAMAKKLGLSTPVLSGVVRVNSRQPRLVVYKLKTLLGPLAHRVISVWGLTFKADTDDLRESPALKLVQLLVSENCLVKAYDPMVSRRGHLPVSGVTLCIDPYVASAGAEAIILATAWKEILSLDMSRVRDGMKGRLFFDARNAFSPRHLEELGFQYLGIGRNGANGARAGESAGHVLNASLREFGRLPVRQA